jgi:hypothetical protein
MYFGYYISYGPLINIINNLWYKFYHFAFQKLCLEAEYLNIKLEIKRIRNLQKIIKGLPRFLINYIIPEDFEITYALVESTSDEHKIVFYDGKQDYKVKNCKKKLY